MNPQYGFVLGNQASRRIDKHGWHTNLKYVVCPSSPSGCIGIGIGCVGIGIGCIGLTADLLFLTRTLFSKLPLHPFDIEKLGRLVIIIKCIGPE